MKKISTSLLALVCVARVFSQSVLFYESMGTVPENMQRAVAAHETADGFDQDGYTYAAPTAVDGERVTIAQFSGIDSPDGGTLAWFGATSPGLSFRIAGINSSGCTGLTLRFEIWKSSSAAVITDEDFVVEYSTTSNTTNYTPISWGGYSSVGWLSVTDIALPAGAAANNLRLRFRVTGPPPNNPQFAIDGISVSGTGCSALPVDLLGFTVKPVNGAARLEWATATERNNAYFSIERSTDGLNFTAIDEVRGAGNSALRQSYAFTDKDPIKGLVYYRLKQVDFDGDFEYSPIRSVTMNRRGGVVIAPSPASDRVTIRLESAVEVAGDWQVFDAAGRLVQSGVWPAESALQDIAVAELPEGVYAFRLTAGQEVQVRQFRKQ
jgi:Secretion system C-terminal sorting domain